MPLAAIKLQEKPLRAKVVWSRLPRNKLDPCSMLTTFVVAAGSTTALDPVLVEAWASTRTMASVMLDRQSPQDSFRDRRPARHDVTPRSCAARVVSVKQRSA